MLVERKNKFLVLHFFTQNNEFLGTAFSIKLPSCCQISFYLISRKLLKFEQYVKDES